MSNHNEFNNNTHGRPKFENFIRKFTKPLKSSRFVLECIVHILGEFEAHHINEKVWAEPDTGLIANYYRHIYTDCSKVLVDAIEIVTYLDGLVTMPALGEYLTKEKILGKHNLAWKPLPTVPFIDFTPIEWLRSKGEWKPKHGLLWEGEPPIGSTPRDDVVRHLGPDAPGAFYDCPMWFCLWQIQERMECCGFWNCIDALDSSRRLRSRQNGLAGRLFWYLVVHIFDLQDSDDDDFSEALIMTKAEQVAITGIRHGYAAAFKDTRGNMWSRVPEEADHLLTHVAELLVSIAIFESRGRWRRNGLGELATVFSDYIKRMDLPIVDSKLEEVN